MTITCFHCSTTATNANNEAQTKVGFRDTCTRCAADLHVCRNCSFYDEGSHHECRESSAEYVRDKERANLCEYFRPATNSSGGKGDSKAAALSALDDLFKK
jgi:hypothetical protein